MLKMWGLEVKGLQSYWSSNFENDLTPGVLGQKSLAESLAVKAEKSTSAKFDGQ